MDREGTVLTPSAHTVPAKHVPDRSELLLQVPPPVVSMVELVVLLLQYVPRGQMVQADANAAE